MSPNSSKSSEDGSDVNVLEFCWSSGTEMLYQLNYVHLYIYTLFIDLFIDVLEMMMMMMVMVAAACCLHGSEGSQEQEGCERACVCKRMCVSMCV